MSEQRHGIVIVIENPIAFIGRLIPRFRNKKIHELKNAMILFPSLALYCKKDKNKALRCRKLADYQKKEDIEFEGLGEEIALSREKRQRILELHSLFQFILKIILGLKQDIVHSFIIGQIQFVAKESLKPSKDYIRKSQFIIIQNPIWTCRLKCGEIGTEITHRRVPVLM